MVDDGALWSARQVSSLLQRRLHYHARPFENLRAIRIPCLCTPPTCSCCAQFTLGEENSVQFGCAEVFFDRVDLGVRLTLKLAGRTVYDQAITAANPPPACVNVPMVPFIAFCAQLYEVRVDAQSGNACLRLAIQLFGSDAVLLDLQCLHLENGMLTAQAAGS